MPRCEASGDLCVERGSDSGERAARLLWPGCERVINAARAPVSDEEEKLRPLRSLAPPSLADTIQASRARLA